jgi:hypothetical protein
LAVGEFFLAVGHFEEVHVVGVGEGTHNWLTQRRKGAKGLGRKDSSLKLLGLDRLGRVAWNDIGCQAFMRASA